MDLITIINSNANPSQDDLHNETFYIDCEYCAEGIHMDAYPNHLQECRLLCKNRIDSVSREYTVGMELQYHASGTAVPRNSRPLRVGLELSVDGTDEYYKLLAEERLQQTALFDNIVRDRLLLENRANWRYESFESFINQNYLIGEDTHSTGLDNPENSKYSELIYIWSITGNFNCNICMQDNYTVYRKLKCTHKLCNSCYLEWFKNNITCPFCRFKLS